MQAKSIVYLKKIDNWSDADEVSGGLLEVWQRVSGHMEIKQKDFVAIKLSFGEEGVTGYVRPEWLKGVISLLRQKSEFVFFAETNTLYRDKRSNAVGHLTVAHAHGYSIDALGIPVIIADGLYGRNSQNIPIRGDHIEYAKIAGDVCESDALISIAHTTGHCQAGFAGTIKNLGMGCASRKGKLEQHSKSLPEVVTERCTGCGQCVSVCPANAIGLKKKKAILVKERCIGCGECTVVCRYDAITIKYDENLIKFQEKMAEYALGVKKAVKSNMSYINFLCNITKNCDCMARQEKPVRSDIGIMASNDPVALDAASIESIGREVFKGLYPEIDPFAQLRHGEKIKLGTMNYEIREV